MAGGLPDKILTVGELSKVLKAAFSNPAFQNIWVMGEITNKTVRSGNVYLELSDPDDTTLRRAALKAILWSSVAEGLFLDYGIGDVVTCRGRLDYYQGNGSVSLIVYALSVTRAKEGKALLAKRKLLAKLDLMGALSPQRKRPLPRFIKKLAIVSSAEAAGFHDILATLAKRYPTEECRLFPAIVQGAEAPSSLASALRKAYAWQPDALIIGRGGGSKGDLSCFDDEKVAMAIMDSPCPVITAIGHQIDISVADRLADKVAITPTDAANLINPSFAELEADCQSYGKSLGLYMGRAIDSESLFLADCRSRLVALLPVNRLNRMANDLDSFHTRLMGNLASGLAVADQRLGQYGPALSSALYASLEGARQRLGSYRELLNASSVSQALDRGFALVERNGLAITKAGQICRGDVLDLRFRDGDVMAQALDAIGRKEK